MIGQGKSGQGRESFVQARPRAMVGAWDPHPGPLPEGEGACWVVPHGNFFAGS